MEAGLASGLVRKKKERRAMAAAGLFHQASHPGRQGTSHSRKVNKAGQPAVHRGPRRSLPPVLLTVCVHVTKCSGVRTHAHTQTCTRMCIVHLHMHHPCTHTCSPICSHTPTPLHTVYHRGNPLVTLPAGSFSVTCSSGGCHGGSDEGHRHRLQLHLKS